MNDTIALTVTIQQVKAARRLWLIRYIRATGLKQKALAAGMGTNDATICDLKDGSRPISDSTWQALLAAAAHLTPDHDALLPGKPQLPNPKS